MIIYPLVFGLSNRAQGRLRNTFVQLCPIGFVKIIILIETHAVSRLSELGTIIVNAEPIDSLVRHEAFFPLLCLPARLMTLKITNRIVVSFNFSHVVCFIIWSR